MTKLDVITFGEPLFLFYANEEGPLWKVNNFSRALAGAETNVATGFARLGFKPSQVTKLGKDTFGKFIIEAMKEEGIETDGIQFTDQRFTGMYMKELNPNGDPKIEYFRRGSAASTMSVEDFDKDYFLQARLMHMTTIFAALNENTLAFTYEAAKTVSEAGIPISFDPNLRPQLWKTKEDMVENVHNLAKYANYFLPGINEAEQLMGSTNPEEICDFYLDLGVKDIVVVKTGADGAYYKTRDGQSGHVAGYKVKPIDTVGAGDAFAVGFASGLLDNLSVEEAILRGNACGARQVTFEGDNDGMPTREELAQFQKETERY